jgi:hypothetical protein
MSADPLVLALERIVHLRDRENMDDHAAIVLAENIAANALTANARRA